MSKIKKHSAADRAGLEVGDKIIAVSVYEIQCQPCLLYILV